VKRRRQDRGRGSVEAAGPALGLEGDVRALARLVHSGQGLDASAVRTLQRTAGNQATLRHLGEGQPLEGPTRARMEQAFGTSFAGVRTHTGPESARLARERDAAAFAVGEQIVFGEGEFKPGTFMGDVLLAHELAHVAQQQGAETAVQAKSLTDAPDTALERDADRSALRAVTSLWGGVRQNAMPALKSGVRLSKWCGGEIQKEAQGSAGSVKSDDITISIEKHERGTPGGKTSPAFVAEGTVTGVDRGIAEIYRLEGDQCNEMSASPPDPIWKVPIVGGKFRIVLPFSASTTPAWGHTFMIKAGDGTNFNTACAKVDPGK